MKTHPQWTKCIATALILAAGACNRGGADAGDKAPGDKGEKASPESTGAVTPAAAGDLAGNYTITSSTNPGGGAGYKGSMNLTKSGDVYQLAWTIANSPPYKGVAIQMDNTLGVGWGMGSKYGVAVYRVSGGKLNGQWATSGSGSKAGTENLEGPPTLSGTYKIVSATTPEGKSYTGSVAIAPTGETFSVKWTVPGDSYSGVGIRKGDLLIVGWGVAGQGAGAVSYDVSGKTLTGKWATPGGTQLGTETLSKN